MLKNKLFHISAIGFLRSDKLLYHLIFNDKNIDLDKELISDIKNFYPNTYREPNIKNSINYIQSTNIDLNYDLSFLNDLFKEFFEIDGTHIFAKEDKLEEYSSFINKVHPFNIIGYYLANEYLKNNINTYSIIEFAKNITTLALKKEKQEKIYADNHIHAGGSINDVASLIYVFEQIDFNSLSLPKINEFEYINTNNLLIQDIVRSAQYAINIINSYIINKKNDEKSFRDVILNKTVNLDRLLFSNLSKYLQYFNFIFCNYPELVKEMFFYYKKKKFSKFWFIYNVLIFILYIENKNQLFLKKAIKILIHSSNIFRSYTLMSQNIGLSEFSKFNRSSLKKNRNNIPDIADSIISNGTDKFELKTTFKKNKQELINLISKFKINFDREIIRNTSEYLETRFDTKFLNSNKSKIKYHFCLNFTRKEDNTKNGFYVKNVRFKQLREDLKKEAIELDKLLNEQKIINKFEFYKKNKDILDNNDKFFLYTNYFELKNTFIDLSKLITTLDVAGDENKTPPEVFAPVIKFLRRDFKKADNIKFNLLKTLNGNKFLDSSKLKLSVHSGEDFNYLVTGLRKIDETIKFYHMRKNDRLGHALALGLDFETWKERNGEIFVTKQEHLDNLVWLYMKSAEISKYLNVVCKLRDKYEKDIKKLSKYIYGKELEINDLYKAWELREYCPIYFDSHWENDEYVKAVKFDKDKNEYEKAIEINKYYQEKEEVYKKGNEIIRLTYNILDYQKDYLIYEEENQLIEAIQDMLIEEIAQKGIILEANPTSNVYISYLNSFAEHPIFRWMPIEECSIEKEGKYNKYGIRNTAVKVCINTDDPLIMPTTIRNEYRNLYIAAKKHTKNIEKIEKWLENLRKIGIEIFDETHKNYEFKRF